MEPIQRQIMLLRPGDSPYIHPQSRATLKLQTVQTGLAVLLSTIGLPAGDYALYLFMQSGMDVYVGDVSGGGLRKTLPGIRLQNVWGAAVIHTPTLAFCLKSADVDWTDFSLRFKLIHAPRTAADVSTREQQSPSSEEAAFPDPNAVPSDFMSAYEPDAAQPDFAPAYEPDAAVQPDFAPPPLRPDEIITPGAEPVYMSPEFPPHATPDTELLPPEEEEETPDCESCTQTARRERINPFPSVFPQSEWYKMSFPGPTGWWHYITGNIFNGPDIVAKAVGVPGEYNMAPPVWLDGFGTYLRCVTQDAHGYWLMFQDSQTGEILDMELSPRDA